MPRVTSSRSSSRATSAPFTLRSRRAPDRWSGRRFRIRRRRTSGPDGRAPREDPPSGSASRHARSSASLRYHEPPFPDSACSRAAPPWAETSTGAPQSIASSTSSPSMRLGSASRNARATFIHLQASNPVRRCLVRLAAPGSDQLEHDLGMSSAHAPGRSPAAGRSSRSPDARTTAMVCSRRPARRSRQRFMSAQRSAIP